MTHPWGLSLAATLAAAMITGSQALHAEPSVSILPLSFAVTEFRGPTSRVAATVGSTDAFRESRPPIAGPAVVVWGAGGGAALTLAGAEIRIRPASRSSGDFVALERGRDAIPGSRVRAEGAVTVTLEGPTRAYPHEALGSPVHARTLVITERRSAPPTAQPKPVATDVARVSAGADAVFEDREPRFVDLDGDGLPEILVVRSDPARGSALAVIANREGAWRMLAETPPDGEPFRWLNPAAAGPASAAGARGIALIRRPHLDGLLQLWRWEGDRLTLVAEKAGYSNHVYGSAAQDLAATLDGDDRSGSRLVLPTLDRRALAIVTLGGSIEEVARIPLPGRAATGVAVLGRGRDTHILVGLDDGRIADVRP